VTFANRTHTSAVLAAVRAIHPRAGDLDVPDDETLPYCIVYPLGAVQLDGSLEAGDEQNDVWPAWQVTSIGSTREQAEWLQDKVRAGLLGTYLTVAGRRVGPVRLDEAQAAQRDTDVTPYAYYAVDRFRLLSTPS
jgi:hypothetical protein